MTEKKLSTKGFFKLIMNAAAEETGLKQALESVKEDSEKEPESVRVRGDTRSAVIDTEGEER